MNIVAFVDHEIGFRLLGTMLSAEYRERLTLRAVVTSQENGTKWWPGVAEVAREHGLPLLHYPADRDKLGQMDGIDFFFLLSWKFVLPPAVLDIPSRGTINLHYSLLPNYRGVYPINWAIMRGDRETGVTFHRVGAEIDAGPAVCQAALTIRPEDTARSLQLRLDDLACTLFDEMVRRLTSPGSPAESVPVAAPGRYYSRRDFEKTNEIDLKQVYRAGELIDLIRGKTFLPHKRNAYFIDPATGRKVYVSLELESEP
jgi:methionyl-tRNA formyltransferase